MGHIPCSGPHVSVQTLDWCSSLSAGLVRKPRKIENVCPHRALLHGSVCWNSGKVGRLRAVPCWENGHVVAMEPSADTLQRHRGGRGCTQTHDACTRGCWWGELKWGALGEFAVLPAQWGWSWRTWGSQGLEADSPHPPVALMCPHWTAWLQSEQGACLGPLTRMGHRHKSFRGWKMLGSSSGDRFCSPPGSSSH